MYSPHMLTPHDMQDAQEDAIRTWVSPHFPSNISLSVISSSMSLSLATPISPPPVHSFHVRNT